MNVTKLPSGDFAILSDDRKYEIIGRWRDDGYFAAWSVSAACDPTGVYVGMYGQSNFFFIFAVLRSHPAAMASSSTPILVPPDKTLYFRDHAGNELFSWTNTIAVQLMQELEPDEVLLVGKDAEHSCKLKL